MKGKHFSHEQFGNLNWRHYPTRRNRSTRSYVINDWCYRERQPSVPQGDAIMKGGFPQRGCITAFPRFSISTYASKSSMVKAGEGGLLAGVGKLADYNWKTSENHGRQQAHSAYDLQQYHYGGDCLVESIILLALLSCPRVPNSSLPQCGNAAGLCTRSLGLSDTLQRTMANRHY